MARLRGSRTRPKDPGNMWRNNKDIVDYRKGDNQKLQWENVCIKNHGSRTEKLMLTQRKSGWSLMKKQKRLQAEKRITRKKTFNFLLPSKEIQNRTQKNMKEIIPTLKFQCKNKTEPSQGWFWRTGGKLERSISFHVKGKFGACEGIKMWPQNTRKGNETTTHNFALFGA